MRIRSVGVAAVLAAAALAFSPQAASAALWMATYSGTVESGTDGTDVFGLGGDLGGASFTAHFKYNTLHGAETITPFYDAISGGPFPPFGSSVGPVFFADLTINGVTDTFHTGQNSSGNVFDETTEFGRFAQTFFYNQFDATDDNEFLQLYVYDAPNPISLTTAYTGHNIHIIPPPIVDEIVGKYVSVDGVPVDAYTAIFAPDTVILQPIPEPAAWALMIAGFGLVGASLRRARRLRTA